MLANLEKTKDRFEVSMKNVCNAQAPHLFSFVSDGHFGRTHVRIDLKVLTALFVANDKVLPTLPRGTEATLSAYLHRMFVKSAIRGVTDRAFADHWDSNECGLLVDIGRSFSTDGCGNHVVMETPAASEQNERKHANWNAARAMDDADKAAKERVLLDSDNQQRTSRVFSRTPWVTVAKPPGLLSTLLPPPFRVDVVQGANRYDPDETSSLYPADSPCHFVPADPGVHGLTYTVMARDGTEVEKMTCVRMKAFEERTGAQRRKRGQERELRHIRSQHSEFFHAERRIAAHSLAAAGHDRAKLIAAVHARRDCYDILFAFYGNELNARHRLANYIGFQREAARVARTMLRPKDVRHPRVLVLGDSGRAHPRSPISGASNSRQGKLLRVLVRYTGDSRWYLQDEFRTSCLDSISRIYMNHPVGLLPRGLSTDPTRSYKRVYGEGGLSSLLYYNLRAVCVSLALFPLPAPCTCIKAPIKKPQKVSELPGSSSTTTSTSTTVTAEVYLRAG